MDLQIHPHYHISTDSLEILPHGEIYFLFRAFEAKKQRAVLRFGQLSVLAGVKVPERKRAERLALEPERPVADRLQHAADLAVSALTDRD